MYDAIVVGVGGMGSAAAYHLARSGCSVLGLERFGIAHASGSSHGSTRIIRLAYSEGPEYVPLLHAAYRYWRELEEVSRQSILRVTGSLAIGPADSGIIVGARHACREHGLRFEELDAAEINRRFPGYSLPSFHRGIHQPDGGYLRCEVAVAAHVAAARRYGARIVTGAHVRGWEAGRRWVRVRTEEAEYRGRKLVITAGPWVGFLLPELRSVCRPQRQVMLWTEPLRAKVFEPDRFPVVTMETPGGRFYGIASDRGEGFKIGKYYHLSEEVDDPDRLDRECRPADEALLREGIAAYFPAANGPTRRMAACMFTNTPDGDFVLDRLPGREGVFVAAGFSGHGFKFASAVGRLMADFCLDRRPEWDIGRFRIAAGRFS